MNHWLEKLNVRERVLLFGGSAVLLVSGLYAYTYQPLLEAQQQLDTAIDNQQRLHSFLQSISGEVVQLRETATNAPASPDQSLLGIIDSGSEQAGIKPAIKRLQPEGQDSVALSLEQCPFDPLIDWLVALNSSQGISVKQINLSREAGNEGKVKGKLLLGL
ncbi:MAG: type II secretion system protein M [Methylovulum sp.]|uniref:type II secretion system protein M n=1 Tax=Methylovulum sp. TaxID=1916980 RepID=UPI00263405FD|nr:type II secretion system protein M [Methylovulum sp.]MDD2722726.1 type II secretion system protein M [Methylovulum sp.]MDD5123976.1 type II secretion system protein M [Methylovulum sp.]